MKCKMLSFMKKQFKTILHFWGRIQTFGQNVKCLDTTPIPMDTTPIPIIIPISLLEFQGADYVPEMKRMLMQRVVF